MSDPRLQNAMQLRRAGRLADAARVYDEILAAEPRHFEALHALGIIRYQIGQIDDAERLIGLAVEVNPSAADAHYNRACLLQRMNRPDAALASFDQAIALKPNYLEALVNKAATLGALQRPEEALNALDRVVRINPNIPEVWKNRAAVLMMLGRPIEVLECFERMLRIDANNLEALRASADLLQMLKRHRDAAERYAQFLSRKPDDAVAWASRGISLAESDRAVDALEAFGKAIAVSPENADAWNHRGNVLFQLKRYDEAATSYERALALAPDLPYVEGYLAQSRLRCCDWSHIGDDRARIASGLRAGRPVIDPFGNLMVSPSPEDQLRCARIAITESSPPNAPRLWQGERYNHNRIRVAYLSADYRPHPVAFLIAGVFEHHDKSRFETIGISFGPPSDSDIRRRMEGAFDQFFDVRNESDIDVAAKMRKMEIDIAIDLTGFCEYGRTEILAFRPAPVQVNYLGFPGTSGADFIDYIIADRTIAPPDHARFFSERIVHLPGTYQANDRQRRIAPIAATRRKEGLPEDATVFCAFNNAYKITPPVFEIWMGLLKEVAGSVLWLLGDSPAAIRNLARTAEAHGVPASRLVFAPRVAPDEHLARFGLADLFLDTLPYNAHTTASDALWTGVPVVTCMGEAFAGRVAASLLRAAGLPQLVTTTLADYRALALELGRNRAAVKTLKETLALAHSAAPLFDTARVTRHLEAAYGQMWRRWQQGEAPAAFTIDEGVT